MAKRRKQKKPKAPRSLVVLGMILTTRPAKFRHKADRRAKDARHTRIDTDDC